MPTVHHMLSERNSQEGSSWAASHIAIEESRNVVPLLQKDKPGEVLTAKSSDFRQPQHESNLRASVALSRDHSGFGEGCFLNVGKTGERRCSKAEKTINLQILRQYFAGSLKDAAKSIGVCPTTLKRICRQHGIKRWPSRKIKKVGHSFQNLQLVIESVQGASGSLQTESFYSNFPELASPNLLRTGPFSASKPNDQSKLLNMEPEGGSLSPQATASKSPSSSCSHSSSSSQCCSNRTQSHPYTLNVAGGEDEDPMAKENSGNGVQNSARSEAELQSDEVPKLLPRSQSNKPLSEHAQWERLPPIPRIGGGKFQEGDALRVKATYGEKKIRFRLQNSWGYENLLQEIARQFSIDDTNGFHLKYLDDEAEWVLLTCNADLEECVDVCGSSQSRTIKLSLCRVQQHSGSFLG